MKSKLVAKSKITMMTNQHQIITTAGLAELAHTEYQVSKEMIRGVYVRQSEMIFLKKED